MSELPPEEPRPDVPDLDLGHVAADDALLDALGRGGPAPSDDPAAALLAAFRSDLERQADAHPGAPSEEPEVAALAVLSPATGRGHRRWSRRAAAVAIVAGVLVSGTGIAAALTAQPGDLLYGVRRAVVGPVDDSYRKNAEALVDQTAQLSAGSRPISHAQQSALLDHAADLVAGIKDPGRKKAMVRKIAAVRVALGLPSQPIPTTGTPLATPGPTTFVGPPAGPVASPTASPTPTPDESASTGPSAVAPSESPSGGPTPSASSSGSGSPSPSASPSRHHRRRPSPSPSASSSPSGSPTYTYRPVRPKPSPTPSPTFIIG